MKRTQRILAVLLALALVLGESYVAPPSISYAAKYVEGEEENLSEEQKQLVQEQKLTEEETSAEEPASEEEKSSEEEETSKEEEASDEGQADEEEQMVIDETELTTAKAALKNASSEEDDENSDEGIMPLAGTLNEVYINPSSEASGDVFGGQTTISAGDNASGDGSYEKPVYTLGKAEALAADGATLNVYTDITLDANGEDEIGTGISTGQNGVKNAVYFTEDHRLTICQATEGIGSLFNVEDNCQLTLQNTTLKLREELTREDYVNTERLVINQNGGHTVLGDNLTLPSRQFYFQFTGTTDHENSKQVVSSDGTAPLIVEKIPASGIPFCITETLYNDNIVTTEDTETATWTWEINMPLIQLPAGSTEETMNTNVRWLDIGADGELVYTENPFAMTDSDTYEILSDTQRKHIVNTAPKLVLGEDGIVYLQAKRVETITTTNVYKGMIFVGEPVMNSSNYGKHTFDGQIASDNNDGLTESTPVRTLNQAKKLLDMYDAQDQEKDVPEYPYPKIILNYVYLDSTDEPQSLDFTGYADASTTTGYRASMLLGRPQTYYIYAGNGAQIRLGEGVIIWDKYVSQGNAALGQTKLEDVKGSVLGTYSTRYFIESYADNVVTLDGIYMNVTSSSFRPYYSGNSNAQLVVSNSKIYARTACIMTDGRCEITGKSIMDSSGDSGVSARMGTSNIVINLSGEATYNVATGEVQGDSYIKGKYYGIVNAGTVTVENGTVIGERYTAVSARNNGNTWIKGGDFYCKSASEPVIHADSGKVYFQGGRIHGQDASDGKAAQAEVKVYTGYGSYTYNSEFILDGGLPMQGQEFLIQCEGNYHVPIWLGEGQADFYQGQDDAIFQVELKGTWTDLSKVAGAVEESEQSRLPEIQHIFDLQKDGARETYEGRELTYYQGYLVLAAQGIYVDGTDYVAANDLGGRDRADGGDGTLAKPIKTLLEAQKIYNNKTEEQKAKLQGVYILNQVTIDTGSVTLSTTENTDISDTTDLNTDTYTCNFGTLPFYDCSQLQPQTRKAEGLNDSMFYLTDSGKLVINTGVVVDGSLIASAKNETGGINHVILADGNSEVTIKGTLQKLNYAFTEPVLYFSGAAKLIVDGGNISSNSSYFKAKDYYSRNYYLIEYSSSTPFSIKNHASVASPGAGIYVKNCSEESLVEDSVVQAKYGSTGSDNVAIYIVGSKVKVSGTSEISNTGSAISLSGNQPSLSVTDSVKVTSSECYTINVATGNCDISETSVISNEGSDSAYNAGIYIGNGKVSITGGTVTSKSSSGVYMYTYSNYAGGILQMKAADSTPVVIQGKTYGIDAYDSSTIEMGGDVTINGNTTIDSEGTATQGENATDIYLRNRSTSTWMPIKLVKELPETGDVYYYQAERICLGKVLVDAADADIDVSDYQERYLFTQTMQERLDALGCLDENGTAYTHPVVTDDKRQLVVPGSMYLFIDPVNGDDFNSKEENGGRTPELAVKSVNGLRALMEKSGEMQYRSGNSTLKIVMLSGLQSTTNQTTKDSKIYGDKKVDGRYVGCSTDNTADTLNWSFNESYTYQNGEKHPLPEVWLYGAGMSGSYAIHASSKGSVRTKNVTFVGKKMGDASAHGLIYCTGADNQLCMENTTVKGDYSATYATNILSLQYITSEIRNCRFQEIEGPDDDDDECAIIWQYGGSLLLEDTILDYGNEEYVTGVWLRNGAVGTIRGDHTEITQKGDNYRGKAICIDASELTFEEGTVSIQKGYGVHVNKYYSALVNPRYIQKDGVKILGDNSNSGYGVYLGSNTASAIIEGGLISGLSNGVDVSGGECSISGGLIENCRVGVDMSYSSPSVLQMSGGAIRNNTEYGVLGGLYNHDNYGKMLMTGGEISGNLYGIRGLTELNLSGGVIRDNTKYGINAKTINISGGEITENQGGGVYLYMADSNLQMTGGTISNNQTDGNGGGISVYPSGYKFTVQILGGTICNNTAAGSGGGIYCENTCFLEIRGGVIEGNRAEGTLTNDSYQYYGNGGGICYSSYYSNTDTGKFRLNGGCIRNNTAKLNGGGIYLKASAPELNAGEVYGNQVEEGGKGNGVYYMTTTQKAPDQCLKLGRYGAQRPEISDTIYLQNRDGEIQATAAVKGYYTVQVNETETRYEWDYGNRYSKAYENYTPYTLGNTVVSPDNAGVRSAASYLTHFTLISQDKVLDKSGTNLILAGVVFVDGVNGSDSNNGTNPNDAFLTVDEVLKRSEISDTFKNAVIYITGAVHISNGKTLTVTGRTIRRYTGQTINSQPYNAYSGPLFVVDQGGTLNLNRTTVSGRMGLASDETFESDGGEEGYLIENYGTLNLDVTEAGGTCTVTEGTSADDYTVLSDNRTKGLAVAQHGTMRMSTFSQVEQIVHLGGENETDQASQYEACAAGHSLTATGACSDTEDRKITIVNDTEGAGLSWPLDLEVDNKYNGRVVTKYTGLAKSRDLAAEKASYTIRELSGTGLYLNPEDQTADESAVLRQMNMVLRMPGIYYVDGRENGYGDDESHDGKSPANSFETLERAYRALAEDAQRNDTHGGLIYIVGTAELPDGSQITYSTENGSTYTNAENASYASKGEVTIRRYSRPTGPLPDADADNYNVATFTETMLKAPAGSAVLEGVTLDGHSQAFESGDPHLAASGVEAEGPILKVEACASLELGSLTAVLSTLLQNNVSTINGGLIDCAGDLDIYGNTRETYFDDANDETVSQPATILKNAEAENGGAVYISEGSTVRLHGSAIQACTAAEKGSAIYVEQNTFLEFRSCKEGEKDYPRIEGRVYLAGNKTKAGTEEGKASASLGIVGATEITGGAYQYELEVQDAYDKRKVVYYYDAENELQVTAADIREYVVYGKQDYSVALGGFEDSTGTVLVKNMLVLSKPNAVYINGVSGQDILTGTTPKTAVKTLKRAYQLLNSMKGGVLYVVDTVTIRGSETLTDTSYLGSDSVTVDGTVLIRRYAKPSAVNDATAGWTDSTEQENFNVDTNTHALFSVPAGASLTLQEITLEGHKDAVDRNDADDNYKINAEGVEAQAPLVYVAEGGTLNIKEGTALQNNYNGFTTAPEGAKPEEAAPGGAVSNDGSVLVTGGALSGSSWTGQSGSINVSASGIWQSGTLEFQVPENGTLTWTNDQWIYLDAEKGLGNTVAAGPEFDGKVNFITISEKLPQDTLLPVDMSREDGLAAGRKVVKMTAEALTGTAEYQLADGITGIGAGSLYFAVRESDSTILELSEKPPQIDVTVPLYVCMYGYGGDGKVVTPTKEVYGLTSKSDCAVQVTSVEAVQSTWKLKGSMERMEAGEIYLNIGGAVISNQAVDTSGDTRWRIAQPASEGASTYLGLPVTAAIAGGSINEDGESPVCRVKYTVKAVK